MAVTLGRQLSPRNVTPLWRNTELAEFLIALRPRIQVRLAIANVQSFHRKKAT